MALNRLLCIACFLSVIPRDDYLGGHPLDFIIDFVPVHFTKPVPHAFLDGLDMRNQIGDIPFGHHRKDTVDMGGVAHQPVIKRNAFIVDEVSETEVVIRNSLNQLFYMRLVLQ